MTPLMEVLVGFLILNMIGNRFIEHHIDALFVSCIMNNLNRKSD
jgi:hypothetical protein